jgi:transposase
MPKIIRLELSEDQHSELERVRDRDARAYMREKAAALLKIAEGQVASQVAENGLHKPHDPDVIYRWLRDWEAQGVTGLVVKKGRGRKAAFSP